MAWHPTVPDVLASSDQVGLTLWWDLQAQQQRGSSKRAKKVLRTDSDGHVMPDELIFAHGGCMGQGDWLPAVCGYCCTWSLPAPALT